ncbi:helix-turn-helix domain-containing protein [Alloyangia pacifica]|uniref:Transcriptional regulator, XRE family with cupin sensor n=1 Tax=Alloyangia pacifica TaxID=311180 RepID=A0A1I6WFM5_9RHOB|nr:XRE family transcriptional regulator [Alloyangia pacifica]SDI71664.1 transcriptional regulator, XRE family with cupin sensor [Alloyangia pacifica]SFT24813.1 transcriptional regulator, XRE family with cupin sensor [Alloyangia pacifica]
MVTSVEDGLNGSIGRRLKAIRKGRKLTLIKVADLTGVSASTLSKIENALVSPSFDIIKRICDGLDIAIEDMVSDAEDPTATPVAPAAPPAMHGRKTTTRLGEGSRFTSGTYDYVAHATELFRKGMVPLEIHVRARSADEFDHWSRHSGEEFVFVLSGELEVHTDLYAPFRLKPGESTYFDSAMAHIYLSVGDEDARVLSISYDPRQKPAPISTYMHVTARPVDPEDGAPTEAMIRT